MKKAIIFATAIIIFGLLIALGPKFLFKVCGHGEDGFPHCHWAAQAEVGMGFLIVALGACMIVFDDPKTHFGLAIGTFLASIIALAVPNFLIGGCGSLAMKCHRIAFPALTAESVVLLVFSAIMVTFIVMQKPQTTKT
jgi:peptidoglycan/LPS O-acetylase OafA/YrhL